MKEWKKILFYAIIPAMIAGIFAVAPKLYDEFTAPKAVLEYKVTKGPMLKAGADHKSIYAIDVINNGKKPLSSVYASIKAKGIIEAISAYESTGLSPVINKKTSSVAVETLHPGESFSISLMLVTNNGDNNLNFVLRSKEALGKPFKLTDTGRSNRLDLFSAIGAAASVFVMSIFLLTRLRTGSSVILNVSHKSDILYYIAARLGISQIIDHYGISDKNITYLRFSDVLLSIANTGSEDDRSKATLALKIMLLNSNNMADISKNMVIRNLKTLEGDEFSEDEITQLSKVNKSSLSLTEQRDQTDEYIASPSSFLSIYNQSETA
jgi:hypothetical protein